MSSNNNCKFLQRMDSKGWFSINHGEGKLFASDEVIKKMEDQNLVVFRYVDQKGIPTQKYPDNPNGSINAIAGVCDSTGLIFGMMPHPEKFVDLTQYPNWRREKIEKPHGLPFFEGIVNFLKEA